MTGLAWLALVLWPVTCSGGERALTQSTIQGVSICKSQDATAPSAASPETPGDEEPPASVVLGRGAADGSFGEAGDPDAAAGAAERPSGQADAPPPGDEDDRAKGAGWVRKTGAALAVAGWATAQFFRSGKWGGETGLLFESDSRGNEVDDGAFAVARRTLQGNVALRNPSLVFGPRALIGNVGANFQLGRDQFTVNGERSPGTGKVAGYDIGFTATPDRAYSAGVFAARTRIIFPPLFGTARERWQTRRGALARLRGPFLESTAEWTLLSFQSTARTGNDVRKDAEDRRLFSYVGSRRSARQTLTIEHRRERRTDLVFPDLSFPLELSAVRHSVLLDPNTSGRILVTSLGFNRRGGTQRRDYFRGESRLDYRLTRALDTRSSYRAYAVDATGLRDQRHNVESRLQHRLYQSLVTTIAARAGLDHLETGDRAARGLTVAFDYRKKLPMGGRVMALVSRQYDREENRFGQAEDVVTGEQHEARFGASFRLIHPRVNPTTIVVSDAAEGTLFREGFDYVVAPFGEFVEIRILTGGRITDGMALLVDYRVTVPPDTSSVTTQPLMDLSVDYNWINPYLRLGSVNRRLTRGVDDGSFFDSRTRAAGLRIRWSHGRVRGSFRNERRVEEARTLSYRMLQFGQLVACSLGRGSVLSVDLEEILTDFRVPARRETRGSGRAGLTWPITPVLSLEAIGVVRARRDSIGFDESFNQVGLEARWERQPLNLNVSLGREWGRRANDAFSGNRVTVQATRAF